MTDEPVRRVSRREVVQGTGVALGSLVASGGLTERVMAQSGGPSDEISGIVEDASGPVEGATVVAVPHDTSLDALETTTDASGAYIFAQSDLYEGSNLYHVIVRDGTESDPRRGVPNYPFIAAEGPPAIPDSVVFQIDAQSLSLSDGEPVTSWDDEVGSGDLSGGSPTYDADGINGNPGVDGDAVDDYLSGDDSAFPMGNSARTIIIVHRVNTLRTEYIFEYGSDTAGGRWTMQVRDSGDFYIGINAQYQQTDPVYSSNSNYITSIRYGSGDALADADVRIGLTDEAFTDSQGDDPVDTVSDTVDVFSTERSDAYSDGHIGEIRVYDQALSDSLWDEQINKLADKWGITV